MRFLCSPKGMGREHIVTTLPVRPSVCHTLVRRMNEKMFEVICLKLIYNVFVAHGERKRIVRETFLHCLNFLNYIVYSPFFIFCPEHNSFMKGNVANISKL